MYLFLSLFHVIRFLLFHEITAHENVGIWANNTLIAYFLAKLYSKIKNHTEKNCLKNTDI